MAATTGPVGLRSSVKNAVDMINPFYSDGYTVERARNFWSEFERITRGMDDDLRLTVFRRCLKGKTGEDWWTHSRIRDFGTLRVRFHNRFMCISPPQMMERLKNAKRSRGESAEEWGDRMNELCDEASLSDPLMRYQYFLGGIRNATWATALQTTMVNSIEDAVRFLLYKNMQIPVERDEDFADAASSAGGQATSQKEMMSMMQQMQNLLSQQQLMLQTPRSPRGRPSLNAVQESEAVAAVNGPAPPFRGVSQAADQHTREGMVVCGRCGFSGHGRVNCPRQYLTCNRCHQQGHFAAECAVPSDQLPRKQSSGNGRVESNGRSQAQGQTQGQSQGRRNPYCPMCKSTGHFMTDCPLMQVLRGMAEGQARDAVPTTTAPSQGANPAQH